MMGLDSFHLSGQSMVNSACLQVHTEILLDANAITSYIPQDPGIPQAVRDHIASHVLIIGILDCSKQRADDAVNERRYYASWEYESANEPPCFTTDSHGIRTRERDNG